MTDFRKVIPMCHHMMFGHTFYWLFEILALLLNYNGHTTLSIYSASNIHRKRLFNANSQFHLVIIHIHTDAHTNSPTHPHPHTHIHTHSCQQIPGQFSYLHRWDVNYQITSYKFVQIVTTETEVTMHLSVLSYHYIRTPRVQQRTEHSVWLLNVMGWCCCAGVCDCRFMHV